MKLVVERMPEEEFIYRMHISHGDKAMAIKINHEPTLDDIVAFVNMAGEQMIIEFDEAAA